MKDLETNLNYNQIDKIIEILKGLPKDSVYLIGMAICPKSIAVGFTKIALIDTIEDVLLSRMNVIK